MPYTTPANEADRLEALRRYRILDTAPEAEFDDIVQLASFICQSPMALVSLVDSERQWFKARIGVEAAQTDREFSFCAHTICDCKTLIVEDATKDARFADNPLVTGEMHLRFYAGAPLVTSDGLGIGSLCVLDRSPRTLTKEQTDALEKLSRIVVSRLELRRASAELARALENVKILGGLLPICGYCKEVRNDEGYWQTVDSYMEQHTEVDFTHGVCPECLRGLMASAEVLREEGF
jgi:GAF domain-containing protein